MLKDKTVVAGVCGGIAAYKIVEVVSRLKKMNADVHVIMTGNAARFVTPLTFQSISHNPVVTGMFDAPGNWDIQHISLAERADLLLVAPATANIIAKAAAGIADDMLSTVLLAVKSPVVFAPAMNTAMYENRIVQNNLAKLKDMGYEVMETDTGRMACGSFGKGRLPEPGAIVENIVRILCAKKDMQDVRVLVTAGPTIEPIDPVRYITNRSSGKMGYAIAAAAAQRGASVCLVSGPVHIQKPYGVNVENVTTADEMHRKVIDLYGSFDIIIMAAAVADYKCANVSAKKIKKNDDAMSVRLVRNPDILKELGKVKGNRILVGMCAETENLLENARGKLESKNVDLMAANDVTLEGAGFETDTNIISLFGRDGTVRELPLMSKSDAAHEILNEAVLLMKGMKQHGG